MSRYGQQAIAGFEERQERAETLRTQGRKGCKAVRINMAFTPSNYRFIKVMARATGRTMTEYANLIIARFREDHFDAYDMARDLIIDATESRWDD